MKNLLKKEFMLTASPMSYIFIAFSVMVLIPNYPVLISSFFVCFGIFQTFQKAREANDTIFSSMLPIKKKDVVKARYIFAITIEMASFVIMAALSLVRILVLNKYLPYSEGTMMNANITFLGFALIVFAIFNIVFIGKFYKTAYKIGIPFLIFAIITLIVVIIAESLHFIPGVNILNSNVNYYQIIVLFIGIATYITGTILSLTKSQNRFEKLDI